jgi:uncharacterized protein Yka (UPF0111/DUF47 family)
MKNEEKILELLAESLRKQDQLAVEVKGNSLRLERLEVKVDKLEGRVDNIESQLVKLNLQTAENTRAIFQLAEKVGQLSDLNTRVTKLELAVFKN